MSGTLFTRTAILVVSAADQAQANQDAQLVDPTTDLRTFRAPLSGTEVGEPTSYWTRWRCTEEQYAELATLFDSVGGRRLYDGEVMSPDGVLAELGLQTT